MASTKDVVDHHLKCFGEGDLEGILSDYAPGAVLFTPDGPLRGADAIRPLFQAMIAEFGKPGAVFSMKLESVEGDYAYILWTAETADNVYEVATDTFVVRDGKIVVQSFAGKITPIVGCRGARHSFCQRNSRNRGRNRSCIHILPSFAEVLHTCHKTCGQLNSLSCSSCRS